MDLEWAARDAHGTRQHLPTHLTVPALATALRLVRGQWPATVAAGRQRAGRLAREFGHVDLSKTVRAVSALTDVDFDLPCAAGAWFAVN